MPPRKPVPAEAPVTPDPVPPGPHSIEVRVNGKIVFLQRMHSYTIDQQDDHAVVHVVLKLPVDHTEHVHLADPQPASAESVDE